mgnify:CR=1 FL=1
MSESTSALAYALLALAVVIWAVVEVTASSLGDRRKERWAQTLLHLLPLALGVSICGYPGDLPWLMDLVGYAPKHPPGAGPSMLMGLLSGAGSVLFHDKFRAFAKSKGADVPRLEVDLDAPLPPVQPRRRGPYL